MAQLTHYEAIFAPASPSDRWRAFEDYGAYLLRRDGALHEEAHALEHKTAYDQSPQARPVHARQSFTPAQTMAALRDITVTIVQSTPCSSVIATTAPVGACSRPPVCLPLRSCHGETAAWPTTSKTATIAYVLASDSRVVYDYHLTTE
jgi:hypothetical protein